MSRLMIRFGLSTTAFLFIMASAVAQEAPAESPPDDCRSRCAAANVVCRSACFPPDSRRLTEPEERRMFQDCTLPCADDLAACRNACAAENP